MKLEPVDKELSVEGLKPIFEVKDLDSLLKSLVGHKVSLSFTPHEEDALRDTDGVLVDFNQNFIHLKLFNAWDEAQEYYLNRHACTLHSITDFGKASLSE